VMAEAVITLSVTSILLFSVKNLLVVGSKATIFIEQSSLAITTSFPTVTMFLHEFLMASLNAFRAFLLFSF